MTRPSFNGSAARPLLCALLLSLLACVPASAQEATGKILGTVTDPQGAVIPGAKVTVTNTSNLTTQITRDAITDEDGTYQIVSLPIGNYRVAIERQGFKQFVADDNKLQINQSLRIDATLDPAKPTVHIVQQDLRCAGDDRLDLGRAPGPL